jgi:serine phosphatase RsbU (regulator of sigma subunit)/pSer/pThr/pTyr-binding forkhead associated (FHA) protein
MPSDFLLEVTNGTGDSTLIELGSGPLITGRSEEADVQLDSPHVSRRHAQLSPQNAELFLLTDLSSRNGTRVNGVAITEQIISHHDRIQIGDFELQLRRRNEPKQNVDPQLTVWSPESPDTTRFTMLASAPEPRLHAMHLTMVGALGQQLLEMQNPQERMSRVCRLLVQSPIACDSAVILRVNRADPLEPPQQLCQVELKSGYKHSPGVMRAVIEAALMSQQPVLAGGVVSSGLTVMFDERDRGITAMIACPLREERGLADLLYVTMPHEVGTVDWLALVALAAEQFKKAELQIEARQNLQANTLLQHEMRKAQKIQMSLVPQHPAAAGLEIAIGFVPCLWVGGDYVNVQGAPDGRVFLAIADVSGKGLPAAMVATGVHSIVHASIRSGISLSEMGRSLNEYLLESLDLQSFVTMFGVMLDPARGEAQCINAGHPPMLIIDPDGTVQQFPCGHNPPLGVLPMTAQIGSAELLPGQLMVLITDGLSELIDWHSKILGIEGVGAMIGRLYAENSSAPLDELRDKLNASLDNARGTPAATDDRTFLLARRKI